MGFLQRYLADPIPNLAALASVLLMGVSFGMLLVRFVRCVMGKKDALGRGRGVHISVKTLAVCALAALGTRLMLYALAWGMKCLSAGEMLSFSQTFNSLWVKWDARHYLKIAQQGYVNTGDDRLTLVFFPLYPWLIRAVNILAGDWTLSAVLVSNAFAMGAAVMLYALCARGYGEEKARWALGYFLVNPYSFFLNAPYSESLFLFLTLCALYACAAGKLGWAGVWGALSALTRMLGLVVLGVILLETLRTLLERRCRDRAQKAVWGVFCALLVTLGFGVYLLVNLRVSGAPFTFMQYQKENWYQEFGSFWNSVRTSVSYLRMDWGTADGWYTWLAQLTAMAYVFVLLIATARRVSLEHGAYSWAYLFIALAPTWLLSGPRYIFGMATLPVLQAHAFRSRTAHRVCLGVSALLLAVMLHGYCIAQEVF
jgi:hypothetical protein